MEQLIDIETAKLAESKGCELVKHKTYERQFSNDKYAADFCIGHVGLLNEKSYCITWQNQNSCLAVLTLKEFDELPTQSAIQTWLRKTHNIIVAVDIKGTTKDETYHGYSVWWYNKRWFFRGSDIEINYTWEQALEQAILIGLEKVKINSGKVTPFEKNFAVIDLKNYKLVRPHGENCGCELTFAYSPALGCPNPTGKLEIPRPEISVLAKDYCDRYFRGDDLDPAYHHAYTAFVNGSKIK
jgi:hypothetical protein